MERSTHMKLANALSGLGAGMQGQGAQWMALQQKDMQLKDQMRRRAMLQDAFKLHNLLSTGNVEGARQLLMERKSSLQKLNGSSAHTDQALQLLKTDPQRLLADMTSTVETAYAMGELERPVDQTKRQVVDGQLVTYGPGRKPVAEAIEGYSESEGGAADRELRRRDLELKERAEDRRDEDLSAGLEKYLLTSMDAAEARRSDAIRFTTLAQEYENRADELYGGAFATMEERWKAFLGDQDAVTEFRRQLNAIRIAEGIGNLPPGVASDKDIELVMSGQIDANAAPEQVVMYLRGAAKLAHYAAGYNQLKVDYISKFRKPDGINDTWRKQFKARDGKKYTVAEIYQTAMSRGMAPQQVMELAGIKDELF